MVVQTEQGSIDQIHGRERDLIGSGYKRVDGVNSRDLDPGQYVISTHGGTETRFEGRGGATISWKPLPRILADEIIG